MSNLKLLQFQRRTRSSRKIKLSFAAVIAAAVLAAPTVGAFASAPPLVRSVNVKGYSGALANHSSRTLYLLSVEKNAKLKCSGACLSSWPPLLVKNSVKSISLGAHVRGTIGFVARSKSMKQVTFNSYPVYTFSGDGGPLQRNGEGVVADGGTWYLVNAASTTAARSAFVKSNSSVTTTTSGGTSYNY